LLQEALSLIEVYLLLKEMTLSLNGVHLS